MTNGVSDIPPRERELPALVYVSAQPNDGHGYSRLRKGPYSDGASAEPQIGDPSALTFCHKMVLYIKESRAK